MGDPEYFSFLLVLCDGEFLWRCAVKIARGKLSADCLDYPMEPENIRQFKQFLPERLSAMTIVEVQTIVDIIIVTGAGQDEEDAEVGFMMANAT
ncbi:MAG: hypothetical protein JXR84_04265 [Anaerolineae bacterium]|nr:hypothetical protein [Anaerolineae bacterium]